MTEKGEHSFARVKLPPDCTLVRKEEYELTTAGNRYRIELFQHQNGTFYAIGVPCDGERLIIYGTPVLPDAKSALQALVDKIEREASLYEEMGAERASDSDAAEAGVPHEYDDEP